jgi:hypothetical protein
MQNGNYISLICDNSVIFQEKLLKVFKCCNFLYVQRRHNCSPAASFADCVITLRLLKVHLRTFLSVPITKKCQILSCDTLVGNERHMLYIHHLRRNLKKNAYLDHTLLLWFSIIFAVNGYCFLDNVTQTVFVMESGCDVGIEFLNVTYTSLSQGTPVEGVRKFAATDLTTQLP